MSCASFGSTSEVAIFYAVDPDPAADMPSDTAWKPVPYTSESLDASLSSTISDQITPSRSYANSKLSQGEITGSISYEIFYGSFLENMLISTLQDETYSLHITEGTRDWGDTESIQNGSTKKCFAFLKRVRRSTGTFDFFLYRGCQIGSMSMSMDPGSLITGDINIMGTGLGNPVSGVSVYKDITVTAGNPTGAGNTEINSWTFEATPSSDLMSGVDSLKDLTILDSQSADTGIVPQSFSINIDNQLRQQYAVGQNTIYASGVASGRFMVTMSLSAYYANPIIFESFVNDDNLTVTWRLIDSSGNGYDFRTYKVKVTSGSTPQAGSADSDLMVSTEMQAFEDATNGTIQVELVTGT